MTIKVAILNFQLSFPKAPGNGVGLHARRPLKSLDDELAGHLFKHPTNLLSGDEAMK